MLALLFATLSLLTSPPPPFASVLYEHHAGSYYRTQAAAWEDYLDHPCATEEAWYHYYKYAQYANRFGGAAYSLDAILARAERAGLDERGFALNYLRFAHERDLLARHRHGLVAHRAAPDQPAPYSGLVTYFELSGDRYARDTMLARLQNRNPLPQGLLEYNYNQLASVAPGALLLTAGDADTYPAWVLQTVYDHRPDVRVINWHLLWNVPTYRARLAEELAVDMAGIDTPGALLDALQSGERPLYLAITLDPLNLTAQREDRLFLTGLALRYDEPGYPNVAALQRTYEQAWRLDHLRQPLGDGPRQAVADQLNRNYLPALLALKDAYGDQPALREELQTLIDHLARRGGAEADLAVMATRTPAEPRFTYAKSARSAKEIIRHYRELPAGKVILDNPNEDDARREIRQDRPIHMSDMVVTAGQYHEFLSQLLLMKDNALLDSAAVEAFAYTDYLPEALVPPAFSKGIIAMSPDWPVTNVSHRGAALYAEWLTQAYNNDRKRKDPREVRFRLPTEDEWLYAAAAGRDYVAYPWGGNYSVNARGCFLGNFRTHDLPDSTRQRIDGLRAADKKKLGCRSEPPLLVRADGFFPNDYGLYNMSGNAAEMVQTPGRTLGGSWLDSPAAAKIGVIIERTLPHPSTGFRLVMEYVE